MNDSVDFKNPVVRPPKQRPPRAVNPRRSRCSLPATASPNSARGVFKDPLISAFPIEERQILAADKWKGAEVMDELKDRHHIEVLFRDLRAADFKVSPKLLVLFLPESDYVCGARIYRQRVARCYSAREDCQIVVIVQRTEIADKSFLEVQHLVAIELGLALIPVAEQRLQLALALVQLCSVQRKPNPFQYGARRRSRSSLGPNVHRQLIKTLMLIPQLGEKRATQLLAHFGNLRKVAQASEADLASVIGAAGAEHTYKFLNRL